MGKAGRQRGKDDLVVSTRMQMETTRERSGMRCCLMGLREKSSRERGGSL